MYMKGYSKNFRKKEKKNKRKKSQDNVKSAIE